MRPLKKNIFNYKFYYNVHNLKNLGELKSLKYRVYMRKL